MGHRETKKARTRELIADAAARLFAARGYDQVLVVDVARAAEVSEQTVYNYFPAKQDLVLDRAAEILDQYASAVRERAADTTPAAAVRPLMLRDLALLEDPALDRTPARGVFAAQCLLSPTLRRFALEFREQQARAVAAVLGQTDPHLPAVVALAYAAALVSVAQAVTDALGARILHPDPVPADSAGSDPTNGSTARSPRAETTAALDALDRAFRAFTPPTTGALT